MISICIPIGPYKGNTKWLHESLLSITKQTLLPDSVVIIDDMADFDERMVVDILKPLEIKLVTYHAPWHLGVASAFNFGVAESPTDLVFMLGSDDTLEPSCLEECMAAYNKQTSERRDITYYWVGVNYLGTEEKQFLPCNAAMVSKKLWKLNGGFPTEISLAPDAALISIMLSHKGDAGWFYCVNEDETLYNYRTHDDTDTRRHGEWHHIIVQSRNLLTKNWSQPTWGRSQ
jgi:glycosyltransferase involved in cell wall biosynthesis